MFKKLFLCLTLPLILTACRNDEPDPDLFHLTLGTEADADIAMGITSAEITINGYARCIDVGIVGDYDSFTLSDDIPDWMEISREGIFDVPNSLRINVSALGGADSRTGKIGFTVFKGKRSQSGTITVTQNPCTLDDLKKTEQRAMKRYLSKFDVVDKLPAISDIRVGSVAPFYKLDAEGTVYMQVVSMGTSPAATRGEKVHFRFIRYSLLYYLENGFLPEGQGNANDLTASPAFIEVGSDAPATTQWGTAIQMPLLLGLPLGSEVNLVVASSAGFTPEIASVIPYRYNLRYLDLNN